MYPTKKRPTLNFYGNSLFILLTSISLIPVWMFSHFLTTDGPCHVYNATILNSFLHHKASTIYSEFYSLNLSPTPNWFTHATLVLLMQFFSAASAEKILISICLISFTAGFRYLVNSFYQRQTYLSYWAFIFFWQSAMFMGFYNYMFSIAAFFWITGYYLRLKGSVSIKQGIGLSLSLVVLYFMHLFGVFLAVAAMGLHILLQCKTTEWRLALKQSFHLAIICLPAILLTANYVIISRSVPEEVEDLPLSSLIYKLSNLTALDNISVHDGHFAFLTALVISALFFLGLVSWAFARVRFREPLLPLALLAICTFAYFSYHEGFLGGAFIEPRLETLAYLLAILCIAAWGLPIALKRISIAFSLFIFTAFFIHRFDHFNRISRFVSDVTSLEPMITPNSTILPIRYSDTLMDAKGPLAVYPVLFSHVVETISTNKPLIFLENYEANTYYFPLRWLDSLNPFKQLSRGEDGIETAPPDIALTKYNKEHHTIDYLICFGRKQISPADTAFPGLDNEINMLYNLIYTSQAYHIQLYKRKSLKMSDINLTK